MRTIMLGCACALFCFKAMAAEPMAQDKEALIDRLLEQTGQSAQEIGQQYASLFVQQLTMILQQSNPNIDPRALQVMEEEVRAVIKEQFVDNNQLAIMMYPIYNNHFTSDDLKQMIAFNDTALGKKLIRVMPAVTSESMQAGQAYGETLGPLIQQRLVARFQAEGIN